MWRSIFDAAGEFNAARLVLLSDWSPWTWLMIGAVVVVVLALSWANTRTLTPRRRTVLFTLRVLGVATLALLFVQPGVRLEHVSRVRNHVVMMIDGSRSMGLPAEDDQTRLGAARSALVDAADTLERWQVDHQLDWFAATDRARPVGGPDDVRAEGDATRLSSALEDISARFQPEDLAAVVVISDGADNGVLGDALASSPDEIPPAVAEATRRLGAPVHVIFTGPDEPPHDVAITDVAYDEFAFVHNAVSIEAEITVNGFEDLALPVTLRRGDAVLGTRILQMRHGESRYAFEFEFVPDKTGKVVFDLEVQSGPGERILVNNRRQFVVRIIRDKIRVLQVVGRPSADQRFLRKLLKKNPNVDLISFFILRTGTNLMLTPQSEMSLIPFPTRELFEVQLGSFDLIVFQNFTYRGYHMERYLPLIRDFVKDGGGFVMIGGDLSFSSGGYAGTPIAEFLPVSLPHDRRDLIEVGRFKPALTEAGRRHPITALSLVPEDNAEIWDGLPKLSGTNRVLGSKPGAVVLLEHPTRAVGGAKVPVVVAGEYGQGRVLGVTTDSTWNWAFQVADDGGDSRHYYKFWGNTIRWLIKDPDLQPVRVEADRDRYPLGAQVTFSTRVVGRDYRPADDVDVQIDVIRAWHDEGGNRKKETVFQGGGRTSELGELLSEMTPKRDGAYRITARALLPGGEVSTEDVFVVAADPIELRDTRARRDTLRAIARAGGGQMLDLGEDIDRLERVEPRVVKVNRRRDVALWASVWWLLAAVVFLGSEWFFRRRWSLL